MGQSANETITQYYTRLQGQANICDLTVECPTCERDVSYREKTLMFQFIRGLHDIKAQERILEASAQVEGGELSLIRVLKLAEAFEMGRANQKLVNEGGQLSWLSEYQSNKRTSRQETRQVNNTKKDPQKCGNCSKSDHSSKLNDCHKKCPAFDQTCTKCQTNSHFAKLCRGGPREKRETRSKSKDNINKLEGFAGVVFQVSLPCPCTVLLRLQSRTCS